MAKRIFILSVLLLAACVATSIAADRLVKKAENHVILTGNEPLPNVPVVPSDPNLTTDSPGIVVGSTQYDYQTNGSSGHRMVLDSQGGRHFVWMKGSGGTYPPAQRSVYFNYEDSQGNWLVPEDGQNISQVNGDGYTQISKTTDDRAGVAYHSASSNFVIYAADNFPGMGIFSYFDPPDMLGLRCYWPYLTIDRSDRVHIVSCENNPTLGGPQTLGYTRSTDGGTTWSTFFRVDTLETISQVIVSSPVSDKVAIVYTHPRDFDAQWFNDVFYIESSDGLVWDFRNGKHNVTNYVTHPNTYFAYTDLAAVYDYNDNLNIIWPALITSNDSLFYPATLFHYSTGSETITEIDTSRSNFETCSEGVWNLPIAKMSMGVDAATNAIYAVYTHFDGDDCSGTGYANGELYMNYSVDGGASWSESVNMTNSPSPNCSAPDCDSDHWSSIAEKVDANLHIVYINDKDAGGVPQTEGVVTDNPVLYMEFPNPLVSVYENPSTPTTFALSQNYPNPFNAKTNISFKLANASNVELSVFDITGARVITLVNGRLEAGQHSINWDAGTVASGVYYYNLKTNGEESTKKMTLLK